MEAQLRRQQSAAATMRSSEHRNPASAIQRVTGWSVSARPVTGNPTDSDSKHTVAGCRCTINRRAQHVAGKHKHPPPLSLPPRPPSPSSVQPPRGFAASWPAVGLRDSQRTDTGAPTADSEHTIQTHGVHLCTQCVCVPRCFPVLLCAAVGFRSLGRLPLAAMPLPSQSRQHEAGVQLAHAGADAGDNTKERGRARRHADWPSGGARFPKLDGRRPAERR